MIRNVFLWAATIVVGPTHQTSEPVEPFAVAPPSRLRKPARRLRSTVANAAGARKQLCSLSCVGPEACGV